MALDLSALKVGDCVQYDEIPWAGYDYRVTAIGETGFAYRMVSDGDPAECWVRLSDPRWAKFSQSPSPPLIDPEQVWYAMNSDGSAGVYPCKGHGHPGYWHGHADRPHFRITATEPVT